VTSPENTVVKMQTKHITRCMLRQ